MNDRAHFHITEHEDPPSEPAALIDVGLGTSKDAAAPLHEVRPLPCFARNEDVHRLQKEPIIPFLVAAARQ